MNKTLRCKKFFKSAVFLILSCVLSAGFSSCPNNTGNNNQPAVAQVKITVKGDNNAIVKTPEFKVNKGAKWETVKENAAIKGITFNSSLKLSVWKLDNESGSALTDSYVFNTDTTVFAVSRGDGEVTITVDGDNNVTSGKGVSFNVAEGTKWETVKTKKEISGIIFKDCFELSAWKLNNESGSVLTDSYDFNDNTTVFAVSKDDGSNPDEKVTITIDGDNNIKSGKGVSFKVNKGAKWQSVKTKPEITGIDCNGKYFIEVWKLNDINGEKLKDDYVFDSDKTIFAVSALYVKVAYTDLDTYLENTASDSEVNYIEVTDVSFNELMPAYPPSQPYQCSPLGAVLNNNPSKLVALKLPEEVIGLSDMSLSFAKCTTLESLYAFPKGIINLEYCFFKCEKLSKIPDIPQGVENIKNCFTECLSMETAPAVPSSVKNMEGCFSSCKNLKKAPVIAAGISDLDMSGCFYLCENLIEAPAIPDGVTSMLNCFYGCKKLKNAPVIPSSVVNMKLCFKNCAELTTVGDIPQNVKELFGCFWGCKNLTTAPSAIPEGVLNIGACFMDCTKLVAGPAIPVSVVNMLMTFKNCTSLKTVVLNGEYKNGFRKTFIGCSNIDNGGIKVKAEHLAAYQNKAADMGTTSDKFAAQQ